MTNLSKKLLAVICMVALCVCFAVAQTNTITHVVDRGETLASIAKRYSTTEAKIIELNPDAAQFVYVGMELTIPTSASQVSNNSVAPNSSQTNTSYNSFAQSDADNSYQADDYEESKLHFTDEIGFGFLNNDGVKGTAWTFTGSIGVNYDIVSNLYIGGRLGYRFASHWEMETNYLIIPTEIGYSFYTENHNFGIIPFTGFDFNVALSGKIKGLGDSGKLDIGGKLMLDYRIGVHLDIYSFNITGSYHVPLNDNEKFFLGTKAYPEISIGYRL